MSEESKKEIIEFLKLLSDILADQIKRGVYV